MAKPTLKKIGKKALKEGVMMITDVGKDIIDGKNKLHSGNESFV